MTACYKSQVADNLPIKAAKLVHIVGYTYQEEIRYWINVIVISEFLERHSKAKRTRLFTSVATSQRIFPKG